MKIVFAQDLNGLWHVANETYPGRFDSACSMKGLQAVQLHATPDDPPEGLCHYCSRALSDGKDKEPGV